MSMYDRILIFDTETGGLDPSKHAILELGAVVWERVPGQDGRILGKFRCSIREDYLREKVTPEALAINGIDVDTYEGVSPEAAVVALEVFINSVYYGNDVYETFRRQVLVTDTEFKRVILGGHNVATFDVGFLKRLYKLTGNADWYEKIFSHRVIDTCGVLRFLILSGVLPLTESSSQEAFKYFDILPAARHTALGDAEATAKLLDKLIAILESQRTTASVTQLVE